LSPLLTFESNKCFVINVFMIASNPMLRPEWSAVKV
jgi:hypothetical protein